MKSVNYLPSGKDVPVTIAYSDEGRGQVIVMLPSLARSGRDFDEVAAMIVQNGFRVIRPEPRGIRGQPWSDGRTIFT